ncbi:MliC family protein [Paracoccus sp. (in: a-proteobacteria)]|uniref:MliC family protein n=1 Tax=Paracoccus sp. TaxID=267 RepID=UPI0035B074B8
MTLFRSITAACLGLIVLGAGAPAQSGATLNIQLETGPDANIVTARYSCDGGAPFDMQYVNADENNLALIPVAGSERVFVQVVSASGVRYVSGAHEWWSKGEAATLTDTMTEAPAQECTELPPE